MRFFQSIFLKVGAKICELKMTFGGKRMTSLAKMDICNYKVMYGQKQSLELIENFLLLIRFGRQCFKFYGIMELLIIIRNANFVRWLNFLQSQFWQNCE